MPYIEQLRTGGLQLLRAYAASPMCGTSRYTTLTGRYASRAASGRSYNRGEDISYVKILNTKLADYGDSRRRRMNTDDNDDNDDAGGGVEDGLDCSQHNLAQVLKSNGYRTGVVGKWHLGDNVRANGSTAATSTSTTTDNDTAAYDYTRIQNQIRQCGFDAAEAIYHENLSSDWTQGGTFTHNMEHLTIRAMEFIDAAVTDGIDFFLYFNPTAPHESGNVFEALTKHSCRDTVEGRLAADPIIPGMTDTDGGCTAYRQSILRRADGDASNAVLGAIWTDDAVGALIRHLQSHSIWDDTLVVFQMDHGKEGKGSLYEPGVRIAQFVHYPTAITPGTTYAGLVSTIDVAPTLLDYAGVAAAYEMDGISWRERPAELTDRCLVTEDDYDRAIICHCAKYLEIGKVGDSNTYRRGQREGLVYEDESAFDLCKDDGDGNRHYVTSPNASRETKTVEVVDDLVAMLECHYTMTDPNVPPRYGICDSLLFRQGFPAILSSTSSSSGGGADDGGQVPVIAPPNNNNKVAADTEDDNSAHQYPPIETDDEILLSFATSEQAKEAEAFAISSAPRTTTTTTTGLAVYGASSWLAAAFVLSSYGLLC
jgi:arylsulfatase A-like enzyme